MFSATNGHCVLFSLVQATLRQKKTELEEKHCDWLERLDVTSSVRTIVKKAKAKEKEKEEEEENKEMVDIENDFSREMHL